MMVNSGYVAVETFLDSLQLAAGVWAIVVGLRGWFASRGERPDVAQERLEERTYLAALLGYLVLGLSLISWLVFYLMLDSFVPQWPGAMCIYGITQIGSGSSGVYGWLPKLVATIQAFKPALVFAAGASLVLYRFYRSQGTRTLLPRVACLFSVVALMASLDATAGLAYVAIPKRENVPTSGCCSASAPGHERVGPPSLQQQQQLQWGYYGCHLVMAGLLLHRIRRADRVGLSLELPLVAMAALTLGVSLQFLIDFASPRLLHLPYHRCLYDLVPGVPESGATIGLLLWGTFCVGWGSVVRWLGRSPDSEIAAAAEARRWCAYALVGYAGSVAMLSLDLWLA
ncbi:MAG TPA: hypothetical protein VG125_31220 [Pirellulales bacterium]|jgi:hypothetical protein|nr:hypothetical protein [Pirellulales bacterium]